MKTKNLLLSIFIIILAIHESFSQKILLVDDNDFILYNSDTLINDLKATGESITIYNIEKEGGVGPSEVLMNSYDAVIWYTSTDGALLNFWTPTTVQNIKKFIDKGKFFWIVGLDIFFDEYGAAPKNFASGDFAYDYLGVEKYKSQSYGDDGSVGCPQMNKVSGTISSFSNILKWVFPTLWWADACDLHPSSLPIYAMGPSSYVLSGGISMHYFTEGKKKVLCTFFDPALIDTYTNRVDFLKDVTSLIDLETSTKNQTLEAIQVYPNPTSDFIFISANSEIDFIKIYDTKANLVAEESLSTKLNVSTVPNGFYICKVKLKNGSIYNQKIIVNHD